jgi:hypothetical protein
MCCFCSLGKNLRLAPLGTAMRGYRVGDECEWIVPYGLHRPLKRAALFNTKKSLKLLDQKGGDVINARGNHCFRFIFPFPLWPNPFVFR